MQNFKKIAQDYNIIKPKSDPLSEFLCRVKQLSETEPPLEIKVCRESYGQWLLDEVCERLGSIQEKDYFGLRFTDKDKQRQWLDLGKNIYSQLKDTHPIVVSFRIKHYPESPLRDLKQDLACYYLYLQLRRDLFSGRLLGKSADLYQLAAYAVQSEIGDFDAQNEDVRYLSDLKLLSNLNSKTEAKITDIHKTLAGLTPDESETKFLEKASQLDTYGVEPFYVKDQKGNNLYVGLTHEGVSTFQGSRRAHLFKWEDIAKIHYQGKLFIIQVFLDEVFNNQQIKKKHVLGFKCESTFSSAALWKWANDRMCFFSLNRSSEAKRVKSGGGIFRKRKTFKFSGRCQREIMQMSVSMMQINDQGAVALGRSTTLIREASQDEEYTQNRQKYNTMPSRERDKILGTQDTLDSLFIPNNHGSTDNSFNHTPIVTPIGSPKTESKVMHTVQSLDHITEEPHIVPLENFECTESMLQNEAKSEASETSSRSSSRILSSYRDLSCSERKPSRSNGDIAGALEQLQLAVSDTVNYEITKAVRQGNVCRHITKCFCVSCLLFISISFIILCALLCMVLTLHYRNEAGSYDYSAFLSDIVSNPAKTADFVTPKQFSKMARNGYFAFSQYIRSSKE